MRIQHSGAHCFTCGAPGARSMMVGSPSIAFQLCPECATAKDAREPHEGVAGGRQPARVSVWSAPPARYPVCRTPEEFVALAVATVGPERARVALTPDPWARPAGVCAEPGCNDPVYKARRRCLVHYWRAHRARAIA